MTFAVWTRNDEESTRIEHGSLVVRKGFQERSQPLVLNIMSMTRRSRSRKISSSVSERSD